MGHVFWGLLSSTGLNLQCSRFKLLSFLINPDKQHYQTSICPSHRQKKSVHHCYCPASVRHLHTHSDSVLCYYLRIYSLLTHTKTLIPQINMLSGHHEMLPIPEDLIIPWGFCLSNSLVRGLLVMFIFGLCIMCKVQIVQSFNPEAFRHLETLSHVELLAI